MSKLTDKSSWILNKSKVCFSIFAARWVCLAWEYFPVPEFPRGPERLKEFLTEAEVAFFFPPCCGMKRTKRAQAVSLLWTSGGRQRVGMINRRRAWCTQTVEVSSPRSGPGQMRLPRFENLVPWRDDVRGFVALWRCATYAGRKEPAAAAVCPGLPLPTHIWCAAAFLWLWRLKVMKASMHAAHQRQTRRDLECIFDLVTRCSYFKDPLTEICLFYCRPWVFILKLDIQTSFPVH